LITTTVKSPVTPERRHHSAFTAFKKVADRRGARCAVTSNARCKNDVKTLCNRLERHAAAFILNMLKSNARGFAFAQHVRQRGSSIALWARRVHAAKTPCKSCIWILRF